jgi:hypothetical protein
MLGLLLAQVTTTTLEEVPRVVGDPPSAWVVIAASVGLLVAILLAGFWVQRRQARAAAQK